VGGGERGGGRSLPSANPANVTAGGATDARCGEGEEGGREGKGGVKQITAHSNPYSSFSLSFFSLCIRRGFNEKIPHVAVQNRRHDYTDKRYEFNVKRRSTHLFIEPSRMR
jgi:hypothetical protein